MAKASSTRRLLGITYCERRKALRRWTCTATKKKGFRNQWKNRSILKLLRRWWEILCTSNVSKNSRVFSDGKTAQRNPLTLMLKLWKMSFWWTQWKQQSKQWCFNALAKPRTLNPLNSEVCFSSKTLHLSSFFWPVCASMQWNRCEGIYHKRVIICLRGWPRKSLFFLCSSNQTTIPVKMKNARVVNHIDIVNGRKNAHA
jgi:hypothetical protein